MWAQVDSSDPMGASESVLHACLAEQGRESSHSVALEWVGEVSALASVPVASAFVSVDCASTAESSSASSAASEQMGHPASPASTKLLSS